MQTTFYVITTGPAFMNSQFIPWACKMCSFPTERRKFQSVKEVAGVPTIITSSKSNHLHDDEFVCKLTGNKMRANLTCCCGAVLRRSWLSEVTENFKWSPDNCGGDNINKQGPSWVADIVEGQVKAQAFLYYLLAGCGQERERSMTCLAPIIKLWS